MTTTSPPAETAETHDQQPACTVYYDGDCPLCQREIGFYQGMKGADAIRWHDVSQTRTGAGDLSTRDAMARFHVRKADGTLVSGARAFFEVMKTIPRLRWLGRILSTPPIVWAAEASYDFFLLLRPALKRMLPAPKVRPRNDA